MWIEMRVSIRSKRHSEGRFPSITPTELRGLVSNFVHTIDAPECRLLTHLRHP
jgi:hypothetical protein